MDGLIALALAKKAASAELSQKLGAISTNLEFKGNVSSVEDLPTDASAGDEYAVGESGLYVWNGTEWVSISVPGPQGPRGPKGDPGSGAVTVFYQTEEPESAADGDIWIYKKPPINYLCFTAEEANAPLEMAGLPGAPEMDLWYSFDKENWVPFEIGVLDSAYEVSTHGTVVTLANVGDKVYFKGNNDHGFCRYDEEEGVSYPNEFIIREKKMSVSGNIMTIMNETGKDNTLYDNNFNKLFIDCYKLVDASELELPSTVLAPYCYALMFSNRSYEYESELRSGPSILPAITLADHCYYQMFNRCTYLEEAPELSAMTLANSCASRMFHSCELLNEIKVHFISWEGTNSTRYWLTDVASSGTFYCPSTLDTSMRDDSHVPTGWTIINY